jgi:predicted phosphodiesterase
MRLLLLSDTHINLPDADVGYAVMDVTGCDVAIRSQNT